MHSAVELKELNIKPKPDILGSQKAEVLELALTTFDRELYEQGLREEQDQKH